MFGEADYRRGGSRTARGPFVNGPYVPTFRASLIAYTIIYLRNVLYNAKSRHRLVTAFDMVIVLVLEFHMLTAPGAVAGILAEGIKS